MQYDAEKDYEITMGVFSRYCKCVPTDTDIEDIKRITGYAYKFNTDPVILLDTLEYCYNMKVVKAEAITEDLFKFLSSLKASGDKLQSLLSLTFTVTKMGVRVEDLPLCVDPANSADRIAEIAAFLLNGMDPLKVKEVVSTPMPLEDLSKKLLDAAVGKPTIERMVLK